MISNPTSNFQAAHGQHRRQQSTPMAFIGAKASTTFPAPAQPNRIDPSRFAAGHRRGVSLDVRRRQLAQMPAVQDFGLAVHPNHPAMAASSQQQQQQQQHLSQQQAIHARPDVHHQQQLYDAYLLPPQAASHHRQQFDPTPFHPGAIPFGSYGGQMNIIIPKTEGSSYINGMPGSKEFDLFSTDSTQSTPTFMAFPESPMGTGWVSEGETSGSRKAGKRTGHGMMDHRAARYESLGMDELQPPATPTSLNGSDYFPPTPLETPHERLQKPDARMSRFLDNYDESNVETIKPTRKRQTQAAQHIFVDDIRHEADPGISTTGACPAGPSTAVEHHGYGQAHMQQMPDYMDMNVIKNEFERMAHQHMAVAGGSQPIGSFDEQAQLHSDASSMSSSCRADSPSRMSRHRRTESVASIASAASIANINIEETRTETGVTLEEIALFIQSPDTTDGKWTCLFEECGKQFGRKENIKSHVQTHLNDRQYQCPTCQKCFVRQHDLKRHAKIHTGIKPYPCACGNSFARHDALTRHRQRGMCIGAFDGIVRKVVKRGRPKKNRPDLDARLEKSTKTRRKNASISSISSQSGYSDCSSVVDSEDNDEEMFDDMLEDMDANDHRHAEMPMPSMSSAPMPALTMTSRTAMDYSPSPALSAGAGAFVATSDALAASVSRPESPEKTVKSQDNTPPDLSQSSSPPIRSFDPDHGPASTSNVTDEVTEMTPATTGPTMVTTTPATTATTATTVTTPHMMGTTSVNTGVSMGGIGEQDDDLLLQFTGEDGLVQLEREQMMMMTKFDEEFDSPVCMFTNNDESFFS